MYDLIIIMPELPSRLRNINLRNDLRHREDGSSVVCQIAEPGIGDVCPFIMLARGVSRNGSDDGVDWTTGTCPGDSRVPVV